MTLSLVERSANDRTSQATSGTLEPSQLMKMALAPWQAPLGGLLKSLQEALLSLALALARIHQQLLVLALSQL